MTGFGHQEASEGGRKITVEIKSVNHRYLDISIKMPKKLVFLETAVRTMLKEYVSRGKVDVFVTYEDLSEGRTILNYNRELAAQYVEYFQQMEEQFHLKNDMQVSVLAHCPDVLVMEEHPQDEEEIWHLLEETLKGACGIFVEARIQEGEALKNNLLVKLDHMLELVSFIEERSPRILAEYREKLQAKVEEMLAGAQVDESRIVMETTIFADKICVDEEMVRLRSHIEAAKSALKTGGCVGRKLDFIAQEMNREANTTLSKANDLEIANCAVDLKTEIEKVREQIQNIE